MPGNQLSIFFGLTYTGVQRVDYGKQAQMLTMLLNMGANQAGDTAPLSGRKCSRKQVKMLTGIRKFINICQAEGTNVTWPT